MHRESFWTFFGATLLYTAAGAIVAGALSGMAYAFGVALTAQRAALVALCGAALGGLWCTCRVWVSSQYDGTEMARSIAAYVVILCGIAAGAWAVLR